MADKEIKQIPFIASEVQMQRLERVINKLIIADNMTRDLKSLLINMR